MTGPRLEALESVGLSWRPSGRAGLRGPLLRLAQACDKAMLAVAGIWDAQEERHPATLPTGVLDRVDYLRSFPQQATFAVSMDADEANLDAFLEGPVVDGTGRVALARLAPVHEVLTPAACYHLYAAREGESLPGPLWLTTRNTCFRREADYTPLRRMASFTMRELVCLGNRDEVGDFVALAREAVDLMLRLMDIPVRWQPATDCFFRPERNPKYLLQRVMPVKHEAIYGDGPAGELAIGSTNLHHDHFGARFGLTRDGEPANSACVAFGIERWLFAITDRHGTDPASWPDLEGVAAKVRAAFPDARA